MTGTRKEERVNRIDLLYVPEVLERLYEEYGPPTEIKRHVKTTAKTYEIRTALHYWLGDRRTHRCSRAVWRRLRWHEEHGIPPGEVERI